MHVFFDLPLDKTIQTILSGSHVKTHSSLKDVIVGESLFYMFYDGHLLGTAQRQPKKEAHAWLVPLMATFGKEQAAIVRLYKKGAGRGGNYAREAAL